MWCVYKHTSPNGKVYIGITSREPSKRWGHGSSYKRQNKHFWNAIQKYGWENIKHEVLYEGLSEEEAQEKEKELIKSYCSTDPEKGYNLTFGGESFQFSEQIKEKMRGPRILSEEQREALKERGKEQYEKNLKGRKPTKEEREKIAAAQRGRKQTQAQKDKRARALKKHWKKVGGFSQEHREKISNANKGRKYSPETIERMKKAKAPDKNPRSRRVRQIDNGNVIAEYCSAREAERCTGISYTSIVRVCNGVRLKHAGGYKWEYVEEAIPLQLSIVE